MAKADQPYKTERQQKLDRYIDGIKDRRAKYEAEKSGGKKS